MDSNHLSSTAMQKNIIAQFPMIDCFRDFQNHANNGYSVPQLRKIIRFEKATLMKSCSISVIVFIYFLIDSVTRSYHFSSSFCSLNVSLYWELLSFPCTLFIAQVPHNNYYTVPNFLYPPIVEQGI